MVINGVELTLDIFDAEVAERYELALDRTKEVGMKTKDGTKLSEIIREQCEAVFEFFDTVFGEGISFDVFGDEVNLIKCLEAFENVIEDVSQQQKRAEEHLSKYKNNTQKPLNRAQRRALK